MSYDVFGVGNAIMDLQVQCDDAFLSANEIEKGIMTLTEPERQQTVLDALSSHKINYCSGGSAANTIVGIADMGGRAAYACKTGDDSFGNQYIDEMRELGIAIEVPASNGTSGTCVVLITPDAQRTMLTHLASLALWMQMTFRLKRLPKRSISMWKVISSQADQPNLPLIKP